MIPSDTVVVAPVDAPADRHGAAQGRWVENAITLPPILDAGCYRELLAIAQWIYTAGYPDLVIDLRAVERVELSGLFALHALQVVMRGETPPQPEASWQALRTVVQANLAAGQSQQVKLINTSARVRTHLQANHLAHCLCLEQPS